MGLEKIAEHIEKETDTKVKKIVLEAQLKANYIMRDADERSKKIMDEATKRARILREEKKEIERAKINVEKSSILKKALSYAFEDSMSNLYKAEEEFSKTKDYERLMSILIKDAKKTLGEDATIFFNKRDLETIGKKEKNAKLYNKKIFGVYAESKDGKLSMDLSLNKIIQQLEEKIAKKVIDRLER